MFYIMCVTLLFLCSVVAHIFFCRHTKQAGLHAKAFIFIALFTLGVYILGAWAARNVIWLDPHSLWGAPFQITAGIIFILLIPIYLCFYVLTQLMSPSKKILMSIFQKGERSYTDILAAVEEEKFITTRLDDLCASRCVLQVNGRYFLTGEGQKIVFILNFMQMLLGRNAGG